MKVRFKGKHDESQPAGRPITRNKHACEIRLTRFTGHKDIALILNFVTQDIKVSDLQNCYCKRISRPPLFLAELSWEIS
jgi:hypothetical protein